MSRIMNKCLNNEIINNICERTKLIEEIKDTIINIEKNKTSNDIKKGIYIYGPPGSGKTKLIKDILDELNYDMVYYCAGDIRNKSVIDTITKYNMSDVNVLSLFTKKKRNIVIVMDEIDGMNSGDKGGITSLIKLVRPKKTKKQKMEDYTFNPIICIGDHHFDKKIKDLMKVCYTFEVKSPTEQHMSKLIEYIMPDIYDIKDKNMYIQYFQSDLRKFKFIYKIYLEGGISKTNNSIMRLLNQKSYNEDIKNTTRDIINRDYSINDHNLIINETDRTIIALLWHENIVDMFKKFNNDEVVNFYVGILENICFADFIDRITFQKQIWQFNEMSSLIKTMKNNLLYREFNKKKYTYNPDEIRFTKVLTKYSTEYNNYIFLVSLTQTFMMDKKDVIGFFNKIRNGYGADVETIMENFDISKLDISRMYRFLDKFDGILCNDSDFSE